MRMVLATHRLLVWLAVLSVWTMGVVLLVVNLWRCH